ITPPKNTDGFCQSVGEKKRINWLDTSRGIAFLMVIYSHLEYSNDIIMRYFSPVFLTTFFFVSGYLFKEKCSFKVVFEQRTRTLLIPFIVFGIIMILLNQILTFNEKISFVESLKGLFSQNGKNQILWFIAALYVYSILFYWVERLASNPYSLVVISFVLFVMNKFAELAGVPNIPWHIHSFGYACFYMGLGKFYKEKQASIDKFIDKKIVVLIMLVFYVLLITIFDMHISFKGGKFVLDALFITLSGLIVLLYISKHILKNSKLLLFVGANTLFYFAFHGKVYSLLQTICHKFITNDVLSISGLTDIIAFGIVLLDALILIIPAYVLNRYGSFLIGKGYKLWK
ncbi:MAG: acyltransferase family protein, partial [Bacteroidaceae bacterium]|nr:acyltransferase family protein [Bacteroidaceae bacterium]